jgi:hypothetical protein
MSPPPGLGLLVELVEPPPDALPGARLPQQFPLPEPLALLVDPHLLLLLALALLVPQPVPPLVQLAPLVPIHVLVMVPAPCWQLPSSSPDKALDNP